MRIDKKTKPKDRTGQTWQDGGVVFLVTGPSHVITGIIYHPVLILASDPPGVGGWHAGDKDEWPEVQYYWNIWEKHMKRIA